MSQIPIAPNPSKSTHGGIVYCEVPSKTSIQFEGGQLPVLLENAIHICPIHGRGGIIATGLTKVDGLHVARQFDMCSCGASIESGSDNTSSD